MFKLSNTLKKVDEKEAELLDNEHIKADMIVMAVGITPNTDFMTDVVQLDSSKKMLAELVERARKVIEIHDTTSKL